MENQVRSHKYNAQPTVYNGVRCASKAEAARAMELDALMYAYGEIRFWIGQPIFRLGCAENVYRPDFLVIGGDNSDRNVWAEDVKGVETAAFKKNKRLWKAYGPCPLRIIRGGKVVETIEGAK